MDSPIIQISDVPDAIYNRLKEQILSGVLPAGEQVKIQLVAEEMGVSIVPVREAIRMLASEGLMVLRPRRSPVVSSLELSEILEINHLRLALEPYFLALAIENHTRETLARCHALIKEDKNSKDYNEKVELNRRFHLALLAPAGQARALKLIDDQFEGISRYGQMLVLRGEAKFRGHVHREHLDILKAVEAGDTAAAVETLKKHISSAAKRIEAELNVR